MTPNIENLTPELITQLKAFSPELAQQIAAQLDEQMEKLKGLRSALSGTSGRGRKPGSKTVASADTSGNKLSHGEAVLKALGYAELKGGATSKQIKELASSKLSHEFGNSLATTLNKMAGKGEVKTRRPDKKKRHYLYTAA